MQKPGKRLRPNLAAGQCMDLIECCNLLFYTRPLLHTTFSFKLYICMYFRYQNSTLNILTYNFVCYFKIFLITGYFMHCSTGKYSISELISIMNTQYRNSETDSRFPRATSGCLMFSFFLENDAALRNKASFFNVSLLINTKT